MPPTPEQLALKRKQLLLQRIEELLPILEQLPEIDKDELHIRFVNELNFFRRELLQDGLQLPLPENTRYQIDWIIREGVFETPAYNELYLRVIDLNHLLKASRFPLLKWLTEPIDLDAESREQIWQLYNQAASALENKDLDSYFKLVWPALLDHDASLNYPEGESLHDEENILKEWMSYPDFLLRKVQKEDVVLTPVFYNGTYRITDANNCQSISFKFTKPNGSHYTPGMCIMIGRIKGQWDIVYAS